MQQMDFKVGDQLVRFSSLYTVTDIKERKKKTGTETILYFEPFYKNQRNETLICSIPLNNISLTSIRRPLSKKQLKELYNDLASREVERVSLKQNDLTKRLNDNDPAESVKILKNLWIENQDQNKTVAPTKRYLFSLALKKFAQEVAFVESVALEEAEGIVIAILEKTPDYTYSE